VDCVVRRGRTLQTSAILQDLCRAYILMSFSFDDAATPVESVEISLAFKEYFWISTGIVRDDDSRPRYLSDAASGMTLTIAKDSQSSNYFLSVSLPDENRNFVFKDSSLRSVLLFAANNFHTVPGSDWSVSEDFRLLLAAFVEASITDDGTTLNSEIEKIESKHGYGSLCSEQSSISAEFMFKCYADDGIPPFAFCWVQKYEYVDYVVAFDGLNFVIAKDGSPITEGYQWGVEPGEPEEWYGIQPGLQYIIYKH